MRAIRPRGPKLRWVGGNYGSPVCDECGEFLPHMKEAEPEEGHAPDCPWLKRMEAWKRVSARLRRTPESTDLEGTDPGPTGDCADCGQPLRFVGRIPQSLQCVNPTCRTPEESEREEDPVPDIMLTQEEFERFRDMDRLDESGVWVPLYRLARTAEPRARIESMADGACTGLIVGTDEDIDIAIINGEYFVPTAEPLHNTLLLRAGEPMPGAHLRGDGDSCEYLYDISDGWKLCNKCLFFREVEPRKVAVVGGATPNEYQEPPEPTAEPSEPVAEVLSVDYEDVGGDPLALVRPIGDPLDVGQLLYAHPVPEDQP